MKTTLFKEATKPMIIIGIPRIGLTIGSIITSIFMLPSLLLFDLPWPLFIGFGMLGTSWMVIKVVTLDDSDYLSIVLAKIIHFSHIKNSYEGRRYVA